MRTRAETRTSLYDILLASNHSPLSFPPILVMLKAPYSMVVYTLGIRPCAKMRERQIITS